MRVLHLVPTAFGPSGVWGGAERYVLELARHMARVVPTTLLTFGDTPGTTVLEDGLRFVSVGPPWYARGQKTNPVHPGLIRHVAAADVVHCHQPFTAASELAAISGRLGGRVVAATDLGGGGWGLHGYVRTDRLFHAHLHISEYSRHVAGHAANPAARVILGGVDTDRFSPDASVPKEPLVVFVGRLLPHKGVDVLIDALPPGLNLEVIGKPYHAGYFDLLKQKAAGKAVAFRHDCDDAELVRAYRRAAAVVLPSVYRTVFGDETRVPELLGQTLLEGMACGTMGIGSSAASLPEVVADGRTGFVVPPSDVSALRAKLEWVRDHPAEAAALGAAGRAWVRERFTWAAVVDRCLGAYRAIKPPASRGP